MEREFVEKRQSGLFYIAGSRVMLDSIVQDYMNGEDPVAIQTHFEILSLDTVLGAIEFYKANQAEVEAAMAERRRLDEEYDALYPNPPDIVAKFEWMRREMAFRSKREPLAN